MSLNSDPFLKRKEALESALNEPITISGLVGPLKIFQRLNGHRHSVDDAATAWYALQRCPNAGRALDLGTGVGTVGLAVLWGLGPEGLLTCIEAQDLSFRLLRANIEANDLTSRVQAIKGDIREVHLREKFPLITGSPPYFPVGAGVIPEDQQKAHARFELRGDVGDYARVAREYLESDGLFVFCFPFQQKKRCISLVEQAGLRIVTIRDVIPRLPKPALFSLYSARLNWERPIEHEEPLVMLDQDGRETEEFKAMQKSRGF